MSTHSLTIIQEDTLFGGINQLVTIRRHGDGSPETHGATLLKMLAGHRVCNGVPTAGRYWLHNGVGCLAAYVVMELKKESPSGGIYIVPPYEQVKNTYYGDGGRYPQLGNPGDDTEWVDESYIYFITVEERHDAIYLGVISITDPETGQGKVLYDGLLSNYNPVNG